ncbi:hypothetical protein [Gaoshiqia sp. Z1-71]|uniref:hypothetical protein n=1 Tax=Gaoshiqia hydrogeniformans TaxID=3290090 RepID=UPI003BF9142A
MITTYFLLALFGIAMAHLEGVVVVYLRKAIGMIDADKDHTDALGKIPPRYLSIEKTREAATIVMLVTLALLVGGTVLDKLLVFLWTFAFWDLFYYLSLYLLIKWPPKLTAIDVLFLIPRPWIAPVWVPIGISAVTIILIAFLYLASFI